VSRVDDSFKIAAVAIIAGAVAYGPRAGAGQPSRQATADPLTSARTESLGPDQLIRLYLGESPPITQAATLSPPQDHPDTRVWADESGVDVKFLVALLPDPIDSDARWTFDPMLDAVNSALAQQHYSLFQASFPDWEPGAAAAPIATRSGLKAHERQPAVVMFHQEPEGKRQSLLVALLAYETPTAGVHVAALQSALEYVDWWRRCDPEPIRILGPTFSGSSASLALALDAFHKKASDCKPTFRIVTGSATSSANATRLGGCCFRTFASAVLSDKTVVPVLIKFVTETFGAKTPILAALIESTPYGDDALGNVGMTIRKYRFPLHISSLRGNAAAGPPPQDRSSTRTPLVLGDRLEPTDRLPVITPATTVPTVDLMLDTIFDQMRRDRVDAIGLFATDTRDKLFLAQQIARALPGVLLFTTDVDALYAHPQYRDAVRGMVVASTYPPVPTDTLQDQRYMFPTSSALGTFNAALTLLGNTDLLEYGQDACDRCDMRPPVWISVVEGRGIWPIALRPADDNAGPQGYSALKDDRVSHQGLVEPSLWMWFVSLLLCGLAACHMAAQLLVFSRGNTSYWLARLLRWSPDKDQRYVVHLAVSQVVLLIAVLMFAGVWVAGAFRTGNGGADANHREEIAGAVMLLVAACALAASLVISIRRRVSRAERATAVERAARTRWHVRQQWLPWAVGLPLGAAFVVNVVRYTVVLRWSLRSVQDRVLFFDRSAHFASGASPLYAMTLVLTPIYLWGLVQAAGLGRPPIARLAGTVRSLGRGEPKPWLTKFNATIEHPLEQIPLWYVVPVMMTLVITGLFLWAKHVVSIESWAFTEAFLFAWLVVQLLFSISLIEAVYVWGLLRDLLRVLAAHPMARAYCDVTEQMLGDRLSPRRPTVMTLGHLVIERQELLKLPALPSNTADGAAGDARRRVEEAIDDLRTGPSADFDFDGDVSARRWGWTKTKTFAACTASADVIKSVLEVTMWRDRIPGDDPALLAWCRRAEVFLGMFVALFFRETLSRLASTLCLMVAAVVLLVIAQVSFTFHPRQILLGLTWIYGVVTVGTAMSIFVAIEKDPVMSGLASTRAGKVEWDRSFWGKVLVYAALPIVTLFAAQFPQLGDMVVQWIGPVQQTLP
jgi:hypothetical protein